MSIQQRYYFRKADRLHGRTGVEAVFSRGKSFAVFPFRVLWLPENSMQDLQAGFGVGVRYFKKATQRNRIRRLMREAYRLQKHSLAQSLKDSGKRMSVFILYTGETIPPYSMVVEKMKQVIDRLTILANAKNQ